MSLLISEYQSSLILIVPEVSWMVHLLSAEETSKQTNKQTEKQTNKQSYHWKQIIMMMECDDDEEFSVFTPAPGSVWGFMLMRAVSSNEEREWEQIFTSGSRKWPSLDPAWLVLPLWAVGIKTTLEHNVIQKHGTTGKYVV